MQATAQLKQLGFAFCLCFGCCISASEPFAEGGLFKPTMGYAGWFVGVAHACMLAVRSLSFCIILIAFFC